MDFFLGDVSYFHGDSFLSAQVQDGHAGDSFGAGPSGGRFDGAVANEEDVGGVGLGEVALGVEHEGVIGSGGGRFHLGEDGGELIAAVDVLVEDVGEGAPGGRGVEDEARLVVDGSLVLGEDEERTAVGVDTRIESGGVFDASRDGEANVDRVGHSVRGEGALELFEQAPVGGHALVFQEVRAATEAIEVFPEFEDAAIVKSQAFPDGIAVLDGGVEGADAGFVTMNEPAVDVNDQVGVGGVVLLEHGSVFPVEPLVKWRDDFVTGRSDEDHVFDPASAEGGGVETRFDGEEFVLENLASAVVEENGLVDFEADAVAGAVAHEGEALIVFGIAADQGETVCFEDVGGGKMNGFAGGSGFEGRTSGGLGFANGGMNFKRFRGWSAMDDGAGHVSIVTGAVVHGEDVDNGWDFGSERTGAVVMTIGDVGGGRHDRAVRV